MKLNVLLYEAPKMDAPGLAPYLARLGAVHQVSDADEAIAHCESVAPNLIVVRAGLDAQDAARAVRAISPHAAGGMVIVATVGSTIENVVQFVRAGAHDVVPLGTNPQSWANQLTTSWRRISDTQDGHRDVRIEIGTRLRDAEMSIIQSTIRQMNNSVPKAAQVLGVSPSTLYRKFERAGLANDGFSVQS